MQAEVDPDVVIMPLPAPPARVARALRGLRAAALLDGVRGGPGVDVAALARLASRVGELLLDDGYELLELNPVVAGPDGAVALEAVARLAAQTTTTDRGLAALKETR